MSDFAVITGIESMQMDAVMGLLRTTHWAAHRTEAQERLAMEHSCCYGAVCCKTGKQVAFARVVSDYGTTYYLCDVIVALEWQGKGIGRAMLEKIQSDPRFCDLRGILVSRDAQDFYSRFGFEKSDCGMVKQPTIRKTKSYN